ncbi:MAG: sugar phosphate isomerase/epimerase [Chloroflexi bacterium]|nr:sugar phosphate isomerase/epimerase [Chloroflexota bacterium]
MRFGLSGSMLPNRLDDFTPAIAAAARASGFAGLFTRFDADDPTTVTHAQCQRVRQIMDDHGLVMAQAIGYRPPLIHPDEAIRHRAVERLKAAIQIAGWLGAQSCHTGPGSFAQTASAEWGGAWQPHQDNWSLAARVALVRSLREAAPVAADCGTSIGLEGHVIVVLDSAETMRDVIDEVGSPAVRCDFDPVNWLTLRTVYRSGEATRQMLAVLGDRVLNAHSKDVVVEPRLVTHIDERATGQGLFDHATLLRSMEALGPERFVILEHAAPADIPAAKATLDRVAAEQGLSVY